MATAFNSALDLAKRLASTTSAGAGNAILEWNLSKNPYPTDSEAADAWARGNGVMTGQYNYGNTGSSDRKKTGFEVPTVVNGSNTPAPSPYSPSNPYNPPPTEMTDQEASERATKLLAPGFEIQRTDQELANAKKREEMPQYMAARRGGLPGMRGGMFESAMNQVTQEEAASIDKIEASKNSAIAQLAESIKNQTATRDLAKWQAANQASMQADQLAYEKQRNAILDKMSGEQSAFNRALALAGFNRTLDLDEQTQANWEKTFGLEAGTLQRNPEYISLILEGMGLDNKLKEQTLNNKYARTGSGSGGRTGGSSTNKSKYLSQAISLAKVDPRLAGQTYTGIDKNGEEYKYQTTADNENYYSLPDLIYAYVDYLDSLQNPDAYYPSYTDEEIDSYIQ